jgi:hypothetical protein
MQDILCSLPKDQRFPSLDVLQAKRGTPEMPSADQVASRLVDIFEQLPQLVESGDFFDIRKLPSKDGHRIATP